MASWRHVAAAAVLVSAAVGMAMLADVPPLEARLAATGEAQPPAPLRLVAFGDTGASANASANVNASVAEGAQGWIGLGDYAYDSPLPAWRAVMAPLLERGAWLALGNHDNATDYPPFFANGTSWSVVLGGARVVSLDARQDLRPGSARHAWARAELCGAPEETRVLALHHNWWLLAGARHPGTEFPANATDMDALVDACGVDLVLAGHEHNYQRMERANATYVVVGTGGHSLYRVAGSPPGTVAAFSTFGRLVLDVAPDGLRAEFRDLDGRVLDSFEAPRKGPAPTPAFAASFSKVSGNEWWIEARVEANAPLSGVAASVDNGTWKPMTLRSWGSWAVSTRAPPGSIVRLQATGPGNATSLSGCYLWTAATPQACPSADGNATNGTPPPDPPPATGFQATFRQVQGNAWWIQASVSATGGTLSRVDASVNGGAWKPLENKGWGWAASHHAPHGSLVRLRATSAFGEQALSGCYRWVAASPTACPSSGNATQPPPGNGTTNATTFQATFHNPRGNEWWVEVDVSATGGTLSGVDARVNGGAWTPLAKQSWGSWAKSLRAPAGSVVDFRATAADGQAVLSARYAWPPG